MLSAALSAELWKTGRVVDTRPLNWARRHVTPGMNTVVTEEFFAGRGIYMDSLIDRLSFHISGLQPGCGYILRVSYEGTDKVCTTSPLGPRRTSYLLPCSQRSNGSAHRVEGHSRPLICLRRVVR